MRAIVALTRGYKDIDGYTTLIQRNEAIQKFFGGKYPLLLFHEGNITPRQQQHIQNRTPNQEIQFHAITDRWPGGYEGMCRFQMWDIWDLCQHYEYILRIDEDCVIMEIGADPFDIIAVTGNVYLRSCYWAESHSETNATLPEVIENLTGVDRKDFYNGKFVYTNVGLARPSFFREGKVGAILKALAFDPEQRKNRWGDLPVLGSLLNIYGIGRVGVLAGMKYKHISHNVEVVCQ
jgi:hypothetical protein